MKTWMAILFAIGLLAVSVLLTALLRVNITLLLVVVSSIWAAIDSSKVQLKKYKSGISSTPLVLFVDCALLWIVGFPWYLSMRYKIKNGLAELKYEYKTTPETAQPSTGANAG